MPRAPLSLCSHTSVTECEKSLSVSAGMAMSRWLVKLGSGHGFEYGGSGRRAQGTAVTAPRATRPPLNCHS